MNTDQKELTKEETRYSKFLALVLRHEPSAANVELDKNGWADVKKLMAGFHGAGKPITYEQLLNIVELNNKKRYEFNEDRTKIRARQGHSVDVDVELDEALPPDALYHGTSQNVIGMIMRDGIKPMGRKHVHLSVDENTAAEVGKRHGKPVVLTIDAKAMVNSGIKFYLSHNGVWLCDRVDPKFILCAAAKHK